MYDLSSKAAYQQRLITQASVLSIATAGFLLLLKIVIWLISDSSSVLSSLTD